MNYEIATIYSQINKDYEYETAEEFFGDIQEDYPKLKTSKLVRFGKNKDNDQYICEIQVPENVADELYNYQEKFYEGEIEEKDHDENLFPGFFNERESVNMEQQIASEWNSATIIP